MQIRFIRSFRQYREGAVISPPDGQANLLIRRGLAEEYAANSASTLANPPSNAAKQTKRKQWQR